MIKGELMRRMEELRAARTPFVTATVAAPWRRAAATTPTMSGDAPDCEMPITSERSSRGRAPYSEMTDGVPRPTDSPCRIPSTYWA